MKIRGVPFEAGEKEVFEVSSRFIATPTPSPSSTGLVLQSCGTYSSGTRKHASRQTTDLVR